MSTTLLALVPAWPLAGFLVLALAGRRLSRRAVAAIGVGSVGLAAADALLLAARVGPGGDPGPAVTAVLWRWMAVGDFAPRVAFSLDALALVMVLVVTLVGFLIHLYAAGFMWTEPDQDYPRFFASMNLFVAAMLVLVLADNLLLLYLGWEGVGLASYLLIGFWYREPANGYAAQKAFIVTRVGDTAMALGLFLLATSLGTLDIATITSRAPAAWPVGSAPAVAVAALLLGGAVGKSAQFPLQTWLPDAMAGPTPVSALIHAATMVTAGVYLIARTHVLFALAPAVQSAVAVVGAVTLLLGATSALVQRDLKRALAYSTMSQVGYMFLALGAGAWAAAVFHLATHAVFKALLFLAAGVVIERLHHEHDVLRMGGLRRDLPLAFWTFLVGAAALAGFPLVTAGFWSKDLILASAWASGPGGPWLWAAGWLGAFLTALYAFRLVFLVFLGERRQAPHGTTGPSMALPLVVLAVLAVVLGALDLPPALGGHAQLSEFLASMLPHGPEPTHGVTLVLMLLATLASLGGLALAWLLFVRARRWTAAFAARPPVAAIADLGRRGWAFDALYHALFVQPFLALSRADRHDVVDLAYGGIARVTAAGAAVLSRSENGRLRWYATAIAAGTAAVVAIIILR